MPSLFIVEDHPRMRSTMIALLENEPDFTVIGEAESAEAALELLHESNPDLLLVDISLPGMDGIQLMERVRQHWPGLPCLVLSGHDESVYGERARAAGAVGYITKQKVATIVPTIRRTLQEHGSSKTLKSH